MSLCIAAGATLVLAVQVFTLAWTHSAERTEWRESWQVTPVGLQLTEAKIKGSGAGMEPPADAVWRDGWFVYRPRLAPIPQLRLAVSGATGAGWQLCHDRRCDLLDGLLGTATGEIVLSACGPAGDNGLEARTASTRQGAQPSDPPQIPLVQ